MDHLLQVNQIPLTTKFYPAADHHKLRGTWCITWCIRATLSAIVCNLFCVTIIPRARMGSESIAHEGERNNCFSKIQLVGEKYRDKTTLAS